MTIILYHLNLSCPARFIRMLAKHIGIEFSYVNIDVLKKDQFKPEFLNVNPQHCVPTIDDNGFILWESRAIATYLLNKYAPDSDLYPKDLQKRAVVDKMLYFDLGTLFTSQYRVYVPQLFDNVPPDPEDVKKFRDSLTLLDNFLSKSSYVAGNSLTIADLSILANLTFSEGGDFDFTQFPHVHAWRERLKKELPYYKEINDEAVVMFRALPKMKENSK